MRTHTYLDGSVPLVLTSDALTTAWRSCPSKWALTRRIGHARTPQSGMPHLVFTHFMSGSTGLPISTRVKPDDAATRARADASLAALLRVDGKPRQSAVTQLYGRYGREFKSYFRHHGASDAQAEDLLQETFIKVIRSVASWSGAGTLEAWLWAVARNTLLSQLRSDAPARATVSLDEQDPEAADRMASRDAVASSNPADAECVKRGLAAFTEQFAEYAQVLERVAVDGWGYEELAQYRGCGAGAAREYLSQCRKRVWQFIGHCYEVGAA